MSESRPASRTGSVSQEAGRSFSTSGGDPYARCRLHHCLHYHALCRMFAEQQWQKQQWLYQLQMTNPQAYQVLCPALTALLSQQ